MKLYIFLFILYSIGTLAVTLNCTSPTPTTIAKKTNEIEQLSNIQEKSISSANTNSIIQTTSLKVVQIGEKKFSVELATTRDEIQKGLMGKRFLEENHGMLFIFSEERLLTFWMKNTVIPLDLIYIDNNGIITDIHTMFPENNVPDNLLKLYKSSIPVKYALEINAGLTKTYNITTGMKVIFH